MIPRMVYFLRPVGAEGPVKIGCSDMPFKRLKTIAVWSPLPLEIAAATPGTMQDEADLHARFEHLRLHGEWFSAAPEITAVIQRIIRGEGLCDLPPAPPKCARRQAYTAKVQWSLNVSKAERWAHGYRNLNRPTEIQAIIDSYRGAHNPPPSAEQQAELRLYIDQLRAMPRAERRWPRPPIPETTTPSQAAAA